MQLATATLSACESLPHLKHWANLTAKMTHSLAQQYSLSCHTDLCTTKWICRNLNGAGLTGTLPEVLSNLTTLQTL